MLPKSIIGLRIPLSLQWLLILLLGLLLGYGIRTMAGPAVEDVETIGQASAARLKQPGAISSSDDGTLVRPARERESRPKVPPLTSEQARLLLSEPYHYRISIDKLLNLRSGSTGETLDRLARFFDWNPGQAAAARTATDTFAANVKALISNEAVVDDSQPGLIKIELGSIADAYQQEVKQLFSAFEELMGETLMKQFIGLGMAEALRAGIGSETNFVVRIEPTAGDTIALILNDSTRDHRASFSRQYLESSPEEFDLLIYFSPLLPPIDWQSVITRAIDAADSP